MRRELVKYLSTYRTTPHPVTGIPPAEMLFRTSIRTKLPQMWEIAVNDDEVHDRNWKRKLENKSYDDAKCHAKPSCIDVGDEVLLKPKKENNLTTEFEHVPYQVMERNGNSITV